MQFIHSARSRAAKFCFLGFMVVGISGTICGQSGRSVFGRVVDVNGDPVEGATVWLTTRSPASGLRTLTDKTGSFEFPAITATVYRIVVKAKSFAESAKEIQYGSEEPLRFVLSPEPVAAEVSVASNYLIGSRESLDEVPGSIERIGPELLDNARVSNFSEALHGISRGVSDRISSALGRSGPYSAEWRSPDEPNRSHQRE